MVGKTEKGRLLVASQFGRKKEAYVQCYDPERWMCGYEVLRAPRNDGGNKILGGIRPVRKPVEDKGSRRNGDESLKRACEFGYWMRSDFDRRG